MVCEHSKQLSEMETKGKQEPLVVRNVICYVCSFREQPITVITYPMTNMNKNSSNPNQRHARVEQYCAKQPGCSAPVAQ